MQTGTASIRFERPPRILQAASVVGPKEAEGPFGALFDEIDPDGKCGQDNWEQAESELQKRAVKKVIEKAHLLPKQIRYVFAGDLLGQCIASSFGISELNCPTIGMYGACSTMGLTLSMGAMFVNAGYADHVLCVTSSHYASAERQFRFPSDYGNQRPLSAEWTVTGSGATILSKDGTGPFITNITLGKIVDMGIKDANNMGAAMVPAFADTLLAHFADTGRNPSYYDAIISGDLGKIGKEIAIDIAMSKGYNIKSNYNDCGLMIFDTKAQDTHAGGSGCACCGSVFSGFLFKQLKEKKIKKLLLIATGALMNSTSSQQGESIPGIAHAVSIEL